jgi:hypothetical protein
MASTLKKEFDEALQAVIGEPSTEIETGKPELAVALIPKL